MSAGDGFPRDMDPFALDAGTAERLVTGNMDVGDAAPEYRGVAATLEALREAADRSELTGMSDAVHRIAGAVVLELRAGPRRSRRAAKRIARVAAAGAIACGMALTGGLAAAGALPQSAQGVASAVLSGVGISVPTGTDERPADHQLPASTFPPATAGSVTPGPSSGSPVPPPPAAGAENPTPHGNTDAELPGTRSHGTPPPTAKGNGKGQAPGSPGATSPGNGLGNHP